MWYQSLYQSRYVADNEWYVWLEYLCLKFLFIILSIFWIYLFFNCVHYPCLMNDGWIWSNPTPMKIHKDSMLQEPHLVNLISLKILWPTSMQLVFLSPRIEKMAIHHHRVNYVNYSNKIAETCHVCWLHHLDGVPIHPRMEKMSTRHHVLTLLTAVHKFAECMAICPQENFKGFFVKDFQNNNIFTCVICNSNKNWILVHSPSRATYKMQRWIYDMPTSPIGMPFR